MPVIYDVQSARYPQDASSMMLLPLQHKAPPGPHEIDVDPDMCVIPGEKSQPQ